MKSLAVALLIIGGVAGQAFAKDDTISQSPTRADCAALSGWSWNETANVCDLSAQQATTTRPQPLTRADCDLAGMSWNDTTLVCDEKLGTTAAAKATNPAKPSIQINIDKSTQRMTVFVDGMQKYDWPVSTGKRGYSTPSGSFTPTSMNEIWYSKQWDNAPMPHAIFYMKDGHAIHGSYEVKNLGKPASHGCVRIAPQNATLLYALVKANGLESTQVTLIGETPGGEGEVASQSSGKARARYGQETTLRGNRYYTDSYLQPHKRGGFFRRLFGGG